MVELNHKEEWYKTCHFMGMQYILCNEIYNQQYEMGWKSGEYRNINKFAIFFKNMMIKGEILSDIIGHTRGAEIQVFNRKVLGKRLSTGNLTMERNLFQSTARDSGDTWSQPFLLVSSVGMQ